MNYLSPDRFSVDTYSATSRANCDIVYKDLSNQLIYSQPFTLLKTSRRVVLLRKMVYGISMSIKLYDTSDHFWVTWPLNHSTLL